MALNKEERQMLKELMAKEKEPAPGPIGRSVQVVVNLANKAEVEAAKKMGFLPGDEPEDDNGNGEDEDDEADEVPNRRGFFDK